MRRLREPARRTVFLLGRRAGAFREGLMVGGESYIADGLRYLGLQLVPENAGFQAIDLERILALAPEVIVEAVRGPPERWKRDWAGVPVPAAAREQIFVLREEGFWRPGPAFLRAVRRLEERLRRERLP